MDQVNIIIYNNIRFLIFVFCKIGVSGPLPRKSNEARILSVLVIGPAPDLCPDRILTSISKATGHKISMWFTQREFSLKDKITIAWKWTSDFAQVTIGHWDIIMCSMSLFFLLIFFLSLSLTVFLAFFIFF